VVKVVSVMTKARLDVEIVVVVMETVSIKSPITLKEMVIVLFVNAQRLLWDILDYSRA